MAVARPESVVVASTATLCTVPEPTWNLKVPDPLAKTESVRAQDYAKSITGGYKLEGCWWGTLDRCVYFVSSFARTELGPKVDHDGQVWRYDPRKATLRLEVIFTRPMPGSDDP